ncbi:MAG: DMT family transporter [Pseudomonadota bacterium]
MNPKAPPGRGFTRGIFYMVLSCVAFAGLWALIRITAADVSFTLMVFYRNLFGALFLVPMLWRSDFSLLRTARPLGHGLRATSGLIATYATFFAIAAAPLADVVAISYAAPLFATLAAAFLLGERIRVRRIAAVSIGLAGMLLVLRPGDETLTAGHWAALGAALAVAVSLLMIKQLTRSEDPRTVVTYSFVLMLPISFVIALPFWRWPSPRELGLLAAIGLVASIGQMFLARSFAAAEASAVLPFDFIRLVLATALGAWLFGERLDGLTILGASVILLATVYLAHREAVLARRAHDK